MRFLHLTVAQFEAMKNPWNGAVVTIQSHVRCENPVFVNGKWGVEGMVLK